MRPIWARRRDAAAFHLGTPEIGTARDSGFAADSSLEGNGFELSVPHETDSGFEASSEFGADRTVGGGIIRAVVGLGKTKRAVSAARGAHSPPDEGARAVGGASRLRSRQGWRCAPPRLARPTTLGRTPRVSIERTKIAGATRRPPSLSAPCGDVLLPLVGHARGRHRVPAEAVACLPLRARSHTACRLALGFVRRGDGAALRCRYGSGDRSGTPDKVLDESCR